MAGIAWYAVRLLTALAEIDQENEYILLQHRKDKKPLIDAPNFGRATIFTPTHHRLEQWPLSLETNRLRLNLIHSPDFIPPLHNKIPSVITIHDLAFLLSPTFVTADSARYYGQVEEAVKHARRIIAVSHSTKNDIINLLGTPKEKIDVIHEAADPMFRPISDKEALSLLADSGINTPKQFILVVGTIEPRKNLTTLIRAYHILRTHYNHTLPLLLAGAPGWLSEEVHQLVSHLGLNDNVRFLGRTDNNHLLALYNLATVLAHPAHYEGFGLPPLEAMACGTPVVCSDAGSLPEVVGDAALLTPPEEVDAWAASLHHILEDEGLRKELGEKGKRRASQFSWKKAAKETLTTYRKAVA